VSVRPRELAVWAFAEVFKNLIQGVQGSIFEIASASRRALSQLADFGGGIDDLAQWSASDPLVSLHHLKQPAAEVGPVKVLHDQTSGRSRIWRTRDLVLRARQPGGITALDAARALNDTNNPRPADKEKARRRLDKLQRAGLLILLDPGDQATNRPARCGATLPTR
jgi:hypothetical protein